MLEIKIISALEDNYIYYLKDEGTGKSALVDPGEAEPVFEFFEEHSINSLDYILNTHHHWDHVNGNIKLKEKYGAQLVAFKGDSHRIKDIDIEVEAGDRFSFGHAEAKIIEMPGQTLGHIAFHFESSSAVFCGDTLFSMGCGRMFEGTPEQMWESLCKLRTLPANTQIYCGHEYTENNGNFCLSIEPENPFLKRRMEGVERLRSRGQPTIPSLLGMEMSTNVFLRADHPVLLKAMGKEGEKPVNVFAELREMKDKYG